MRLFRAERKNRFSLQIAFYAKNASVGGHSSFMMQVECGVAILQHTGIRRIKNSQYV